MLEAGCKSNAKVYSRDRHELDLANIALLMRDLGWDYHVRNALRLNLWRRDVGSGLESILSDVHA